jgi:hypothetical protein
MHPALIIQLANVSTDPSFCVYYFKYILPHYGICHMRSLVSRVFYFKWRMKFSVDRHRCMPADEQWTAVQARVAVQVPRAESLRWFWPGCWSLILRWNGKASENPSRLDLECFCWGRVDYTFSSKERTCVDLGSYVRAHACMLCCFCFPSFLFLRRICIYVRYIYTSMHQSMTKVLDADGKKNYPNNS